MNIIVCTIVIHNTAQNSYEYFHHYLQMPSSGGEWVICI